MTPGHDSADPLASANVDRQRRGTYQDHQLGVMLELPVFPSTPIMGPLAPVIFSGPVVDGHASTINVIIEPRPPEPQAYQARMKQQFQALGLTLQSAAERRVDNRPALFFDYEGTINGRRLRFLNLVVFDADRAIVFTCTAESSQFHALEPEFLRCLASVHISRPAP